MGDGEKSSGPARLDLCFALASGLATLAVVLVYRPWSQPAQGDIALFQTFGRLIANGAVPYRDFFDQKTPLTEYANAPVSLLSSWFGFDYVLGTRGLSVALFSLGGAAFYLLCRASGLTRVASLSGAMLFSAADFFAWNSAVGLEPKQLMAICAVFGLLAACYQRWLVSGLFCSLAFLAWQPGGVVLLAAAARALIGERRKLLRSLGNLTAGFGLPVVAMLVYFTITGALGDFWGDTVTFNRDYVGEPPWPPPLGRAVDIINRSYADDRWLFFLGAAALCAWSGGLGWSAVRRRNAEWLGLQLPMVVMTLGSVLYSAVHLGDVADIVPFAPLAAFWCAWLLSAGGRLRIPFAQAIPAIGLVALVWYGQNTLVDKTPLQEASAITLDWQRQQVRQIEASALVTTGDPVYVVNTPWFVLLSDHRHVDKYYYLWNGVDRYAIERSHDFSVLTRPIESEKPKLVVVGAGADAAVGKVVRRNYIQIDPASIPNFRFPDPATFWVRSDLATAGVTAKLVPVLPVPPEGELCEPADLGPGYTIQPSANRGWVDLANVRDIDHATLTKIGFQQGYTALLAGDATEPQILCAAAIFLPAQGGRNWIQLARQHICAGCREVVAPAFSADALLTVGQGAGTTPATYGASILVSRDHLLISVSADRPADPSVGDDELAALVQRQAVTMLGRFR